jgi:WD40 repeat protein
MNAEAIFAEALAKHTPTERAAYLDEVCGQDTALRNRVDTLLRSHEAAGSFLGKPAIQFAAEQLAGQATGERTAAEPCAEDSDDEPLGFLAPSEKPDSLGRLGHYEVLEVIGRGGMGIVLRAFDEKLHRIVAIKVMAPELAATSPPRKRFLREARSAAAVRHEHVVDIHAVEEQPIPHLVMEYVSGETLQQKLDRVGPLEVPEVLRLGQQIARGLAAAHERGLIHRDIKPSNILLEKGAEERVKITDFGLARAVADASLTQSGVIAGTPMYMAPEQTVGDSIDHRADLFSLGSVLYTMCSGRPPFRATTSMATLKRVAEDTPRPIREIIPEVPPWLCDIIAKLHAKKPDERFQSAKEVADLLGKCLAELQQGQAISVGQADSLAQQHKVAQGPEPKPAITRQPGILLRRKRRWIAAAAVLLFVLGGFSLTEATGVTQLRATVTRIFTPEGTLVVETDDPAVKVTIEGDGDLVISGAGPQEVRLRAGSYRLQATKDGKPVKLDRDLVSITRGDRAVVKVRLEGTTAATGPDRPVPDGRHTATVRCVAYSPDGKLLASGAEDSLVIIRDADTLRERARLRHPSWVYSMAFSPDSGRLATVAGGRMKLWDVKTATELPTFRGHVGLVRSVAFSRDGSRVLSGGNAQDWLLRLWDAKTGEELRRFKGHSAGVWSVAFSRDGRRALSSSDDGTVRLWDLETGELLASLEGHTGSVRCVAFSPDGSLALSGGGGPLKDGHWLDCTVRVWDLKTQQEIQRYESHSIPVWSVVFLPDGRRAISAGGAIARMWDVRSGKDLRGFEGHSLGINGLSLSPDGSRLATGSDDHTVRLWDLATGKELLLGVAAPEKGAFVVLGGGAERKFDTFEEAVAAADHGDTIEIRGDGPFETDGVEVDGRALVIRAAPGCQPVLSLSAKGRSEDRPIVLGDAALVLEGLTFQRIGSSPNAGTLVSTGGSPLRVANCRFVVRGTNTVALWAARSPTMDVRNCQFVGSRDGVIFGQPPEEGTFSVDNCLLATLGGVTFDYNQQVRRADVRLTRNTFVGAVAVVFGIPVQEFSTLGPRPNGKPFRVEAQNNIFAATDCTFRAYPFVDVWRDKPVTAAMFKTLVADVVAWRDQRNLYPPTVPFMATQKWLSRGWGPLEPLVGSDQLDQWREFAGPGAAALRGTAIFAGGNVFTQAQPAATPERLLPKHFRLLPQSPGYRAGKDGKDLGADVELVGPGEAYERWKKTPEYQKWLKETGQKK